MSYVSVSFTHKNTDISVREKLSFSDDVRKKEILRLISSNQCIKECMVLSTCNRVEILAYVSDLTIAAKFIILAISKISGVSYDELETRADIYEDQGAIHHLFSVAASLDSLVVGETQIVSQLKEAYAFANLNGNIDLSVTRAIQAALKCAAEIRVKTDISKNPISVSSVAVAMAKEKLGTLENATAIVIGAGEMSELACKHLLSSGANVIILNRNEENAHILAKKLNTNILCDSFDRLGEYVNEYNLIFSATGATGAIITNAMIDEVPFKRYFFDIAVPRDIEIAPSDDIEIYAVDDLEYIVRKNLALREEQAQIAYGIVGHNTTEFFRWLKSLASTPIIKALREKAKEVSECELEKAICKGYLKHSDLDEARRLIHQVFKAFLHTPTINLKNLNDEEDAECIVNSIQNVFDIKEKFDRFFAEDNKNKMEMKDEI